MRFALGFLVLLFNATDNATTFFCLSTPTPGFQVTEANPIARWVFETFGLMQGLILEGIVTAATVVFLVYTQRIPPRAKLVLLAVLAMIPAWASLNNLNVLRMIGMAV